MAEEQENFNNMHEDEIREAQLMLDAAVAFRGAMSSSMRREILKRFCELSGLPFHEPPIIARRNPAEEEELQNTLQEFIGERCEVDEIATCSCRDLYDAFSDWCLARGMVPPSKNVMGGALHSMKLFVSYKTNSTRKWRGVKIKGGLVNGRSA